MFAIERVERRSIDMFEVHLRATGTHVGVFDLGAFQFRPTNAAATFHVRELLTVRAGRIIASTLSCDMKDIIGQLSKIDYRELGSCLERLRVLVDEFSRASGDGDRQRDIADRLGPELDAARRIVRQHYNYTPRLL